MATYGVTVDGIALVAATAKTIFELGTTANVPATIVEFSVTFDGVSATNTPVKVEAQRFSAAVTTATTQAGVAWGLHGGTAASTTKHTTTTEGAGTATAASGLILRVPPSGGFLEQFPLGREFYVPVSSFFRLRLTAAQAVNVSFHAVWDE